MGSSVACLLARGGVETASFDRRDEGRVVVALARTEQSRVDASAFGVSRFA